MAHKKTCSICDGRGDRGLRKYFKCSTCCGRGFVWRFEVGERITVNHRYKTYKGRPKTTDGKHGIIKPWPKLTKYRDDDVLPVQLDGEDWVEWFHSNDLLPGEEIED